MSIIHEYVKISEEAQRWGRNADHAEITNADMKKYLKSNKGLVILGTLLRIAKAIESLQSEVRGSRMCHRMDRVEARLNEIAAKLPKKRGRPFKKDKDVRPVAPKT